MAYRIFHSWELDGKTSLCFDSNKCSLYAINSGSPVQLLGSSHFTTVDHNPIIKEPQKPPIYLLDNYRPRSITLHLTNNCNLNCSYCFQKEYRDCEPSKAIDFDIIKVVVGLLAKGWKKNLRSITFFGGEPLLEKELMKETVIYCKKSFPEIPWFFNITTNGILFDEELLDFVRKRQFRVMVSIDGPVDCGFSKSNNAAINNIMRLKKVIPDRLLLRVTLMPSNNPQFRLLGDFFEELGIPKIRISLASLGTIGTASSESWARYNEIWLKNLMEYSLDCLSFLNRYKRFPYFMPIKKAIQSYLDGTFIKRMNSFFPCGIYREMIAVGVDGNYYPCHRFTGLKSAQIIEKLFSKEYSKFVIEKIEEYKKQHTQCEKCWCNCFCSVGCPYEKATNSFEFSDFRINEDYCAMMKGFFEIVLSIIYLLRINYVQTEIPYEAAKDKCANLPKMF